MTIKSAVLASIIRTYGNTWHTNRHVYHFKILQQGRMYGVIPDEVRFPSVAAMLEYYSDHDVPGLDAGKSVRHIRLRDPIYRHPELAARVSYHDVPGLDAGKSVRHIRLRDHIYRYPELAARSQSVEETRMPAGKSLRRYMSVPSESGAEGREQIKSSPWQLQQEQQIQPQEPLSDDMLEDHYEVPRNVNLSQLPTLMSPEEDTEGACSCGIPHQVSHLTHGWEVHRVHHKEDVRNVGKLFFHNKKTEETLWTLPPSVSSQLTEESRRALEQLESEG
uniref:WW domain-containing protein n=1 Tax=Branchiostoma floridae TaxID=7739 RepID=C3YNG0_BRAFL|eukprot:XP_002602254.1 hypothetical protein BRAFLDRAFT_76943 [Branchiostoma floridae]